jgi:hypothetical protein
MEPKFEPFTQKVETLTDHIDRKGLTASMLVVQGMAQDLSLKYDKQFVIGGIITKPPVVAISA